MMHILEELYVGSIRPGERTFKQNSQYSRAIKELTESEEKLDATLSKEQKLLFNDYRDAQQDLMVITDCETFIRGFQIGASAGYSLCVVVLMLLTEQGGDCNGKETGQRRRQHPQAEGRPLGGPLCGGT